MSQVPHAWTSLRIVQQLDGSLRERVRRLCDYMAPLLTTRPIGSEELTDHDMAHSARVLQQIWKILPDEEALNRAELYILTVAALLHDAGLWTRKENALQVFGSDDFREYLGSSAESAVGIVNNLLESSSAWIGELALQRLVGAYHRSIHAERLRGLVEGDSTPEATALRTLIGEEYVESVLKVAIAHSWERDRVVEDDDLRSIQMDEDYICIRFLAALLRLGDLLDLGEGRISTLLWTYLRPLNPISESHWRKEKCLRLEQCSPERITVSGTFDVTKHGSVAAEAYDLAQNWLDMLASEVKEVAWPLNHQLEPCCLARLRFGRLLLDRSRVRAVGTVFGGQVKFEFAPARLVELLGDEIYRDKSVFARELLQNAVDATRAQLVRDVRQGDIKGATHLNEGEPWNWPHEVTGDARYAIHIDTRGPDATSAHFIFTLRDQGIGMSLSDLENYFLKVGKSFYRSPKFEQEFSFRPISQFGIGFLSCLAIADRIQLTSRKHNEVIGFSLSIQRPSEHFLVTKAETATPGTSVTLWITREEMSRIATQSHYRPFSPEEHELDVGPLHNVLQEIATKWAACLEVPVMLNGKQIGPRDPWNYIPTPVLNSTTYDSVRVRVLTQTGQEVARGRAHYEVYEGTHLPYFHNVTPDSTSIVTYRGIGVTDLRFIGNYHTLLVAIDYRMLPDGVIAASRASDVTWNYFSHVASYTSAKLRRVISEKMLNVDPELCAIWQTFLDHRSAHRTLEQSLLPVRDKGALAWLEWTDICSRYERFILVPFGVAWRGTGGAHLPLVGISSGRLDQLKHTERSIDGEGLRIDDCRLVAADGCCSGYLWPPLAAENDVATVTHACTYTHRGLVKLSAGDSLPNLRVAIPIDSRLVSDADLAPYDRESDYWLQWGTREYSRPGDGSISGLNALQVVEKYRNWHLGDLELDVVLPHSPHWE